MHKNPLKRVVSLIIGIALAVNLAIPALADTINVEDYYSLSVPTYKQEKTKWCWAACAQMIGKYKSGTTYSQSSICYYVFNQVDNVTATIDQLEDALYYTTRLNISSKSDNLKFSTSQGQLEDDRPFILRIKKTTGGGHVLVVCGYGYNADGKQVLRLIDPATGTKKYWRYHDLVNSITLDSCSGYWSHTVYIKKS